MIDVDHIAERTIALWRERGYRSTRWQDIADATGVSVRTLMRHFGSRAEIPWVGVAAATRRLEHSLAAAPDGLPVGDALRHAVVDSVTRSEQVLRTAPDWLALVAAEPDLMAVAPRAYEPWISAVAAFIARRNPDAPPAICAALGTAYHAAAFAALTDWAARGAQEAPDLAVDRMLRWLDVHPPAGGPGRPDPGPAPSEPAVPDQEDLT